MGNGSADLVDSVRCALAEGKQLDRRLTMAERRAVAVLASQPTNVLHISSQISDPAEYSDAFRSFRKRLNNELGRPWVYVASPARALGAERFHLHCLHWNYLPPGIIRRHCRESGMGEIPRFWYLGNLRVIDQGDQVLYSLHQNEPLFGSLHHRENQAPPKHSKAFLCPKRKTLDSSQSKLLSLMKMAESRSVSDFQLLNQAPYFNRDVVLGEIWDQRIELPNGRVSLSSRKRAKSPSP